MQAFILAAGLGTRLRPITLTTPKPLVSVAGVPLLEYHIANLKRDDIQRLIINVHHLGDKIEQYVHSRNRFGFQEVLISHEEPEILGTAGALKKMERMLEDEVLVIYGDNFTLANYRQLIERHRFLQADATIAVYTEPHIESKGMVLFEGDFISGFIEKPKLEQVVSHWANAGLYILNKSVITQFVSSGFSDFGIDIFPKLLNAHKKLGVYRMQSHEFLLDIGTHANLARATTFVEEHPQLFQDIYRAHHGASL